MKTLRLVAVVACLVSARALARPRVGGVLPPVRLSGKNGGLVTGQAWASTTMLGKLQVVFYVDPDNRKLNAHVGEALDEAKLDLDYYGSVAIINMGATWLPNLVISRSLKSNQKKYPRTVYVKDLKKSLVKRWGLADDGYDVIVLDALGTVLFYGRGKLGKAQTKRVVGIIRQGIDETKKTAAPAKAE